MNTVNPRVIEVGTEITAIQELTCPHNSFYVPQGATGVVDYRVDGSLSFRVKFPPNDKHDNPRPIMVREGEDVEVGLSPLEKRVRELEDLLTRAYTELSHFVIVDKSPFMAEISAAVEIERSPAEAAPQDGYAYQSGMSIVQTDETGKTQSIIPDHFSRMIPSQRQLLQMVNNRVPEFDLIQWCYAHKIAPNHMARMLSGSSPMPDDLRLKLQAALFRVTAPVSDPAEPAPVKLTPVQKNALLSAAQNAKYNYFLVAKWRGTGGYNNAVGMRTLQAMARMEPPLVQTDHLGDVYTLTPAGIQARNALLVEARRDAPG